MDSPLIRYFLILILAVAVAAAIVLRAARTSFVEHDQWTRIAASLQRPDRTIHPLRGNIFSHDHKLMAVTIPSYYLYIDFRADGFLRDSFLHHLDSLALALAQVLPSPPPVIPAKAGISSPVIPAKAGTSEARASAIRSLLLQGFRSRNRQCLLSPHRVSYATLKRIRSFPFLRLGRMRSGFYTREMAQRQKPFGSLASRTLGDIYGERLNGITRGKNGLELQYDSLLRGQPGLSSIKRLGNSWTTVTEIEPLHGCDIRTTIDIHIQDITESALLRQLRATDAESGTAVVMDVASGEIKAITNLARSASGLYHETRNHAVADATEPGSTFKVASILVALEHRLCTPHDSVDTGNGIFPFAQQHITDHNAHLGGYGRISVDDVIRFSSNIGIAKIILHAYADNPEKFVRGLYRLGLNDDLHLEIPGAAAPHIPLPSHPRWSKTSLPWMAFGYETRLSPLHILTFFNAIANNGRMMQPRLTLDISRNGKLLRSFPPKTLRSSIASHQALHIVRQMLIHAVDSGTGRPAKSPFVDIAGKTGTAQIASPQGYRAGGHQVSFCGYFPAHKPRYSLIVVIRKPRVHNPSAGLIAGSVVKDIAQKVHAAHSVIVVPKLNPNIHNETLRSLTASQPRP
jgi:cell division protein FtsI (penicillin-binding protein 3)